MEMTLELNLVKTQTIQGSYFELIERERVVINNGDQDVYAKILEFLNKHMDILELYVTDKLMLQLLREKSSLTTELLASIRFAMATYGIDIISGIVADTEINGDTIPENFIEYNVINNLDGLTSSQRFITKIPVSSDNLNLSSLYETINNMYGFFDDDMFADFNNPILSQVSILKETEAIMGTTLPAITNYLNSVMVYLGKSVIAIAKTE